MPSGDNRKNGFNTKTNPQDTKLFALMAYRKAKGLCFKCEERWGHSHVCAATVPLHLVEKMWAMALSGSDEVEVYAKSPGSEGEASEQLLAISCQATQGGEGKKTMRLHGLVQG